MLISILTYSQLSVILNFDELVKSGKKSHSRLRGNDIEKRKWVFYETVNFKNRNILSV